MLPLLGQESCMRVKVQKMLHTTLHSFLAWSSPNGRSSKKCYRITVCVCVAQLCLTLYDPLDCSLPGSSVHEIFQARGVEWVAKITAAVLFSSS